MPKQNTIPQELMDIARDLGCNVIDYVTTTAEGDIYSLAAVDETGEYLPIGLPMLYAVHGTLVTEIDQDRAIDILSKL